MHARVVAGVMAVLLVGGAQRASAYVPPDGGGDTAACKPYSGHPAGTIQSTQTVNATATGVDGRPASGVRFELSCTTVTAPCDFSQPYTYSTQVVGSCTTGVGQPGGTGTGTCKISRGLYNWEIWWDYGTQVKYISTCEVHEADTNRQIDWQINGVQTATTVDFGATAHPELNNTWNATTINAVPNITYTYRLPAKSYCYLVPSLGTTVCETRSATAELYLSPDGVYDKPLVIGDGMDPTNERTAPDMFAAMPAMKSLMDAGVDVWFINFGHGRESVRYHVDDTANLLYLIQKHGGLNRIDMFIGISESGTVGRYALAGMEQVKVAPISQTSSYGNWFTYQNDATRRATGHRVRAFISWDSPQRGATAMPVSMQTFLRLLTSLSLNDLKTVCAPNIKGLKGLLIKALYFLFKRKINRIINEKLKVLSAKVEDILAPFIDGGPAYDQMNLYCTSKDPASCTTARRTAFVSEMNKFNGDGWPRQVRRLAFSQGTWATHRCIAADQWGAGTCSGPAGSYMLEDETGALVSTYKSPRYTTPNNVKVFTTSDIYLHTDLPTICRNDIDLRGGSADLLPGSTTDLIGAKMGDLTAGLPLKVKFLFLPSYQGTASALSMDSSTARTPFHDVIVQPHHSFTHQDIAPASAKFMMKYVWEYTQSKDVHPGGLSDGDGFPTCGYREGWYGSAAAGNLCSCDSNDGAAGGASCSATQSGLF